MNSDNSDAKPADQAFAGMDMMKDAMGKMPQIPSMMPVMAKMVCEMTPEGMVIRLTPSMGSTVQTMSKSLERMNTMMAMGIPLVMMGMGMPMVVCRNK